MDKPTLAKYLTYFGILPFLFALLSELFIDQVWGIRVDQILLVYGAVIVSFISGIHWGLYLFKASPINLFIHSNIITLLAWVAALLGPIIGNVILILCLGYLLFLDKKLYSEQLIDSWYFRLRARVTSVVVAILLLSLLF